MRLRTILCWAVCATVAGCGGGGGKGPDTPTGCDPENLKHDVNNCGECGHHCSAVPHAGAACVLASCDRKPCDPGWLDLTEAPGCETEGYTPVPESGLVFAAVTAGGSFDAATPASETHRLQGSLGEPTPVLGEGAVEARSQGHRNVTGFNAAMYEGGNP